MFEKDLSLCVLFDKYAQLLSDKKREAFDLYYNNDFSLAEISEHTGTSRQAVRDLLAHAADELRSAEAAMLLCEKRRKLSELLDKARISISSGCSTSEICALLDAISELYE
ncbi:hypothetical protein SDC9_102129 [bioreactor metagenome]|uniref:Uncharacterized protein n=1 Tax=bioreactor metagenome TaxID=1076179 RepID=A0A645APZ1_9ZZZZ|nr:sigma factor-like helix-turn-helix DNA-binding protein [Oscillospiraceae bacterium]